ncbi:MAG: DNA integrity scanning protein DisA nucleotide-binding domain protein, partial [Deltaproteobacteria bacterium]|nr:DNA integrity scanning protein DisA nucleotide-binding domain protein [Deltaproteobacteria bacterium]
MNIFALFNEINWYDLVDVTVMTFLVYTVLVWFKKTRAAAVLIGILIIAGFYLVARQFNLFLTASVFQAFFAVILVAVVVIFQEELRYFFERVAVVGFKSRFDRKKKSALEASESSILVRTLFDLAKEKIGALVVLRGKDMILRHLDGGESLGGKFSESLLKSLFDPSSPGHDGAVIIENGTVNQFSAHLPLSKNFRMIGKHGTRHAAALGLSELSDALCLVVSEEKGSVSAARHGALHTLGNPEELDRLLERFYREIHPPPEPKGWKDFFEKNLKEKVIAFGIAGFLWFMHVYGSKIVYRTFTIPVETPELPEQLTIAVLDPKEVAVTFSGPRRSFYFIPKERIHLLPKGWQV